MRKDPPPWERRYWDALAECLGMGQISIEVMDDAKQVKLAPVPPAGDAPQELRLTRLQRLDGNWVTGGHIVYVREHYREIYFNTDYPMPPVHRVVYHGSQGISNREVATGPEAHVWGQKHGHRIFQGFALHREAALICADLKSEDCSPYVGQKLSRPPGRPSLPQLPPAAAQSNGGARILPFRPRL